MQNAPDSYPPSHLPIGLIKLCRQLRGVIAGVLLASIITSILLGVISSAIYDVIKEQVLENLWIDILSLICVALLLALIYAISVHDLPDSPFQQKLKRPPSLLLKLTYIVLLFALIFSAVWYITPLRSLIFPPDTGLGVSFPGANAAPVGLCDGSCVIDINRLDGKL